MTAVDLALRTVLYALSALVTACILLLAVLLAAVVVRARMRRAREAASAAARPLLHGAVVAYLAGSPETGGLRLYLKKQRGDVADAILLFQNTVTGSARDRLCQLAQEFGLVDDWCAESKSRDLVRRRTAFSRLAFASVYEPVLRLSEDLLLNATQDPDEEVRLAAARGLLQSRGEEEIEHVFAVAISTSLLTRIVLTEDLRRHAMELCAGPVRTVLRGGNMQRIRAVLEVLVAWERAIPLDDVREFLDHHDRDIRVQAFRLAPLVAANFVTRSALVRALHDSDQEIRTLAVIAAGRLKMTEAMAELASCMRDGDLDMALHAAEALAAMPRGLETLAELASSSNAQTARAASEALAHARSNP